ncbi:MAG: DUF72 domain-containing protein [Candidatus Abyssubacteria bacterium]
MTAKAKSKFFVGCSGWNYRHWKGVFYPEDISQKDWFQHYAKTFDTVEINNTFYNLPAEKTFRNWAEQAEKGFIYSVKANRYITHVKRLRDPEEPVHRLISRVRLLDDHAGPILFQLPPNWNCNLERLAHFITALPPDFSHVFEFRDQSWINDEVFALLEEHEMSHCVHDMEGLDIPRRATGKVAYVRFHGYDSKYGGNYPEQALRPWADWMTREAENGRDVYAYFNNDAQGFAIKNAKMLRKKLTGD